MDDATARSLIEQAEAARVRMRGRDDASTIAAVEAEYPAMREALDWLLDRDHPEDAFRLASALVPFWLATKRIDDGDAWFDTALRSPAGGDAARARGPVRPRVPRVFGPVATTRPSTSSTRRSRRPSGSATRTSWRWCLRGRRASR